MRPADPAAPSPYDPPGKMPGDGATTAASKRTRFGRLLRRPRHRQSASLRHLEGRLGHGLRQVASHGRGWAMSPRRSRRGRRSCRFAIEWPLPEHDDLRPNLPSRGRPDRLHRHRGSRICYDFAPPLGVFAQGRSAAPNSPRDEACPITRGSGSSTRLQDCSLIRNRRTHRAGDVPIDPDSKGSHGGVGSWPIY